MHQWKNPLCACGWKPNKPEGNAFHAFVSLCPQEASVDNLSKSDQEFCVTCTRFRNSDAEWNALAEPLGVIVTPESTNVGIRPYMVV